VPAACADSGSQQHVSQQQHTQALLACGKLTACSAGTCSSYLQALPTGNAASSHAGAAAAHIAERS
jgi:hypothetical protein